MSTLKIVFKSSIKWKVGTISIARCECQGLEYVKLRKIDAGRFARLLYTIMTKYRGNNLVAIINTAKVVSFLSLRWASF